MKFHQIDKLKKVAKNIVIWILQLEASLVLRKYKPTIIAVTGTVGKTSTKDAIFTVLKEKYYVRKSEKSYNSQVGVPLTILGLPNAWGSAFGWIRNIIDGFLILILSNHYPKWLVLEIGVDRPNDMKKLTKWIKPDYVVLTKFSRVPVHLENFNEIADIWKEKMILVKNMKYGGTVFYNGDDEEINNQISKFNVKNFSYGLNNDNALKAERYEIVYIKKGARKAPAGINFKIEYGPISLPAVISGALGIQHIYPALAAISVGIISGLNIVDMAESLSFHQTPLGRMKILSGANGSVIIDDSYNSSPIALDEALNTYKNIKWSGTKIAVLGDMLELGNFSQSEHIKAGEKASDIVDILIVVGMRASGIADGAISKGLSQNSILRFNSSTEAGIYLRDNITSKDIVLIKGSQGVRMEKVSQKIIKNSADAEFLLVRQEKEWLDI